MPKYNEVKILFTQNQYLDDLAIDGVDPDKDVLIVSSGHIFILDPAADPDARQQFYPYDMFEKFVTRAAEFGQLCVIGEKIDYQAQWHDPGFVQSVKWHKNIFLYLLKMRNRHMSAGDISDSLHEDWTETKGRLTQLVNMQILRKANSYYWIREEHLPIIKKMFTEERPFEDPREGPRKIEREEEPQLTQEEILRREMREL